MLAGIAIVIMAIALDRATAAIADRTDPARRHLDATSEARASARIARLAAIGRGGRAGGTRARRGALYPDEFETSRRVYTATIAGLAAGADPDAARLHPGPDLVHLRHHRADRQLHPRVAARAAAGVLDRDAVVHRARRLSPRSRFVLSGLRPAITAFADARPDRVMGVWAPAMDTASQVLVATVLAVVLGLGLGIRAAESPRVSSALRPVQRRPADAAAARLHHPLHLPDAGVDVPGVVAACSTRSRSSIARRERRPQTSRRTRSRPPTSFGATAAQVLLKVQDPAGPGRDHARRQPGDHHGARSRRDRRARRLRRGSATRSRRAWPQPSSGWASSRRSRSWRSGSRSIESPGARNASTGDIACGVTTSKTKEVGWIDRDTPGVRRLAALAVVAVGALGVSVERASPAAAAKCGSVTMDENAWAGATANVYVAEVRAREELGCKVNIDEAHREHAALPGDDRREGRRRARGLGQHRPKSTRSSSQSGKPHEPRLERRHRPHRLVHPALPAEAAPRVQDLDGAEGKESALQDAPSPAGRGSSSAATRPTSRRTSSSSRSSA